jgi:hypothetical protein
MPGLLFVSQAVLDSWVGQGKVDLDGTVMSLRGVETDGRVYALHPAVRFLEVVGGDADPHGLVAKVKSEAQLRSLGAEQLGDSVILGDVAYEVQPGFLAEGSVTAPPNPSSNEAGATAQAAPPPVPPSSERGARPPRLTPLPRELEEKRKEAEALARFLLENLS